MGKLAFDPKPAPSVLPVGHAHPLASDLGGLGLQGEGDVLLQGIELLVGLSLEGVGEYTTARAGTERRRGQFVGVEGAQRGSGEGGL